MFLRFSRGKVKADSPTWITNNHRPTGEFLKAVFLGDSLVMEYGDSIIGVAKLHEETDRCCDYDVVVVKHSPLNAQKIARCIKDMIGKSNKFLLNPSTKRRKYYVEEYDGETLPIKAQLVFSKL